MKSLTNKVYKDVEKSLSGFSISEIENHVGLALRANREALGLSQEYLAKGLGVSFQQIQKYETGKNRISAGKLLAAARIMNLPVSDFYKKVKLRKDRRQISASRAEETLSYIKSDLDAFHISCDLAKAGQSVDFSQIGSVLLAHLRDLEAHIKTALSINQ